MYTLDRGGRFGVPLGTRGRRVAGASVTTGWAHLASGPSGRIEPRKARVKGPQWWTASSAARQHARGAGRPARKDARRSCLHHTPSVSSESQHQSKSERGSVGGERSTVSDRRGAGAVVDSAPVCARHAAAAAAARSARMSQEDLMLGWV
jgi:hypothetical protein